MARLSDQTKLTLGVVVATLVAGALAFPIFNNFNGDIATALFIGVLLIAVAVPLFFHFRKLRAEAYEGVIEFKGSDEHSSIDANDDVVATTLYYVVVKLADGTEKRAYITEKLWSEWQVGQAIVKRAGRVRPELA